ncbi:tRNA (guanosine(46)-N7)-methyltransferase TrmB [Buchnera aphidicola]|uniref:tRNA (guanine-N(7)-)-methyltransferase n=1 Tax=Buchnera aphidicola (Cinara strobi) TaxID=1921549 RepID=A0A3B1E826_9GAMM|nr:tRNA (guanosine(46)-N7)-methyltransferase TrmB [Buchnera aphidicola]VAX76867.1 tRNA (guanine-N(7)-)-methyltransferase [Buchnera aphidicola (Cinara strobi)]
MIFYINDIFCKNNNLSYCILLKNYSIRRRRINEKKKKCILKCWKKYGIDFNYQKLDFFLLFPLNQFVLIEIGFGNGKLFIKKALRNPHINFIGIEIHPASIFSALLYARQYHVTNIKIIFYNALDVLNYMIPDKSIGIFQIFFPDPWFKLKHHKRRLINLNFIRLIEKKLIKKGYVHIITDCNSYSQKISTLMHNFSFFKRIFLDTPMNPLLGTRDLTKFEKKGILLNNTIYDYKYQFLKI